MGDIYYSNKISPYPSFPKRGILKIPLWKRGIKGDLKNYYGSTFTEGTKNLITNEER